MYMWRTKMKTPLLSKWYHPLLTRYFSCVPALLRRPTVVRRDTRRVRICLVVLLWINYSFKAELHQRACNCCRGLSDVSVFPLCAFCYWIFSAAEKKRKEKKDKDMLSVGLTSQWKHYTLIYLEIDYYCHYCYLYNFYKSPFEWPESSSSYSKAAIGDSSDRGEVSVRLDIRRIFTRVQPKFTEVRPVLAAGGRLAHLQRSI